MWSFRRRVGGSFVVLLGLFLFVRCGGPPPTTCDGGNCGTDATCVNNIDKKTINPNGRPCQSQCDCNNQNYTGSCDYNPTTQKQACNSRQRTGCTNKGEKKTCLLNDTQGCRSGIQVCQDEGLDSLKWGDCKPSSIPENTAELCGDGFDNDCDGKTDKADDDCKKFCDPGQTRNCHAGKDHNQQGNCRYGKQTCQDDGTWNKCEGEVTPKEEVCNTIDDDCDGEVDEQLKNCSTSPKCKPGEQRSCYSSSIGCQPQPDGTYKCTSPCVSGLQTCTDKKVFETVCKGEITPKSEKCNDIDDDCDGEVDEDFKTKGQPCEVGQGECANKGTQVCDIQGGGSVLKCSVSPKPKTDEICDGKDNDCNGKVDDDLQRSCFTGVEGCTKNSNGTYQCKGSCRAGTQRCVKGSWSSCQNEITPEPRETCNLKDDDCDGRVDNIKGTNTPVQQACYAGKGCTESKGSYTCLGTCKAGTAICTNGNLGTCTQLIGPSTEYCNNKDDDCDGMVDNNVVYRPGTDPACANQKGVCRGSRPSVCKQGTWSSCTSTDYKKHNTAFQSTEICDGKDNNCDGSVDENLSTCVIVTTLAGSGSSSYLDGEPSQAQFEDPSDLVVGPTGAVFVVDRTVHRIRRYAYMTKGTCGSKTAYTGYCVTTVAGSGNVGFADGAGLTAKFNNPSGIAIDGKGTLYISDTKNHRIRKITFPPQGQVTVTTLAGDGSPGRRDGPGNVAQFNNPTGLAVDAHGNVYVADRSNHSIRMITPQGSVSTIAGKETSGYNDGVGSSSLWNQPSYLTLAQDGSFSLYISDTGNRRIRRLQYMVKGICSTAVDFTGFCATTLAGSGVAGDQDGKGTSAQFRQPSGLTIDRQGVLFVADAMGHKLRQISPLGQVTTLAGSKLGYKDGTVNVALLNGPVGLTLDPLGDLYVADGGNYRIRKVIRKTPQPCPKDGNQRKCPGLTSSDGICVIGKQTCEQGLWSVCRGQQHPSFEICNGKDDNCDGKVDELFPTLQQTCSIGGSGCQATGTFQCSSTGLSVECKAKGSGISAEICDGKDNDCDGKIDNGAPGCVTTLSGDGKCRLERGRKVDCGPKDGPGEQAQFEWVSFLQMGPGGILYAYDRGNQRIRKIFPNGMTLSHTNTLAKLFPTVFPAQPFSNTPSDMMVDAKGQIHFLMGRDIYTLDASGRNIKKHPKSLFTTGAGLSVGASGDIYATLQHCLVHISPTNKLTQLVRWCSSGGHQDGDAYNTSRFSSPSLVRLYGKDQLFIVDGNKKCVRHMDLTKKVVTTVAGSCTSAGFADGPGTSARFSYINGLALDAQGNLYLSDKTRVRKIQKMTNQTCGSQPNHTGYCVTTYAGGSTSDSKDGPLQQAQFRALWGITVGGNGDVYIADNNSTVQYAPRTKVRKVTAPSATCSSGATRPCYSGAQGTQGKGLCKSGTQECINGRWSGCRGEVTPQPELCNGIDENCDGVPDDNPFFGPLCPNQIGACQGSRATSCVKGKWQACTIKQYQQHSPLYDSSKDICDAVDNNCNGPSNETYPVIGNSTCAGTLLRNTDLGIKNPVYPNPPTGYVSLAADHSGNLFVHVSTSGGGTNFYRVSPSGVKTQLTSITRLMAPTADNKGNVFFTTGTTINKIDSTGLITPIAGSSQGCNPSVPCKSGPAGQATFYETRAMVVDSKGNIYVAEGSANRIRKISYVKNATCLTTQNYTGYCVTVFAGTGKQGYKDGPRLQALLEQVASMAIDKQDNIYVTTYNATQSGNAIRRIDTNGSVSTVSFPLQPNTLIGYLASSTNGNIYIAHNPQNGGGGGGLVLSLSTGTSLAGCSGFSSCGNSNDGPITGSFGNTNFKFESTSISGGYITVDGRGVVYYYDGYAIRMILPK